MLGELHNGDGVEVVAMHVWGQGINWKSLLFSLNFAVNLKSM